MEPSESLKAQLHKRLPIDDEEQILAVFRHHWFAYFSLWVIGIISAVAIIGIAALLTTSQDSLTSSATSSSFRGLVMGGSAILALLIVFFFAIPVWLRAQEQLVLTDEALIQILQPSLFASKISQLSLQHVADASVRRDFFGTILGYGKVTIETPGEQDNYEFVMVSNPEDVVRKIITAHEAFTSALESGRMPSNWRGGVAAAQQQQAPVQLSAEEYQKFLDYQRSQAATQPSAPTEQTPPEEPPRQ